jgi:hypothetical protein
LEKIPYKTQLKKYGPAIAGLGVAGAGIALYLQKKAEREREAEREAREREARDLANRGWFSWLWK